MEAKRKECFQEEETAVLKFTISEERKPSFGLGIIGW